MIETGTRHGQFASRGRVYALGSRFSLHQYEQLHSKMGIRRHPVTLTHVTKAYQYSKVKIGI
jgi:hypothetical protein